jgi:succinate dehydrogenase/fumarate reductase flavoprotein subunit
MAESQQSGESQKSKIPRYIRSKGQIPTASIAYRQTLQRVSQRKQQVVKGQETVKKLKEDLQEKRDTLRNKLSTSSEQHVLKDVAKTSSTSPVQPARKVIYTPGGTKREGIYSFSISYINKFTFSDSEDGSKF